MNCVRTRNGQAWAPLDQLLYNGSPKEEIPGVHSPAPATVDHVSTPSTEIRLSCLFFGFFTFLGFRALNVVGTCAMHALCWQAPVPGQPRHFPVKSRHFPVNPCHFPVKPRHFPVKHCNELLQKKLQLAEIWNWRIQKSIFRHTTGIWHARRGFATIDPAKTDRRPRLRQAHANEPRELEPGGPTWNPVTDHKRPQCVFTKRQAMAQTRFDIYEVWSRDAWWISDQFTIFLGSYLLFNNSKWN